MTELSVRPYETSDEQRTRELSSRLTEGFAPWRSPSEVERTVASWIDDALARHDEPGRVVLVADDGSGPVAFIALTAQDHYIDGRDAYIGELAVDGRCEGKGVGSLLIDAATDWAKREGCERLTLQTGAANQRARGFYERLGFEYEDVSFARSIQHGATDGGNESAATG